MGNAWDKFKSVFKDPAKFLDEVADCLGSWNTSEHFFAGSGKFPMFTKEWWSFGTPWSYKGSMIKNWWDDLGCMQKIMYVTLWVIMAVFLFFILFGASDIFLDFEDLGIFFEGFFTDMYDFVELMFDWTLYFTGFVVLSINPMFHIISGICTSLGIGPLPMYILVAESTAIILLLISKFIFIKDILPKENTGKRIGKTYNILNYPLKEIQKAIGKVFGKRLINPLFDVALFPIRILFVLVDVVFEEI